MSKSAKQVSAMEGSSLQKRSKSRSTAVSQDRHTGAAELPTSPWWAAQLLPQLSRTQSLS